MTDLPPVKIHMVAQGVDGVTNAFKTIEDRARHLEQAMNNLQKRGQQVSTSTARASSRSRISAKDKEYAQLVRQTEKWGREEIQAEKRKNQQIEADAKRSANARNGFFGKVASNTVNSMQRVASTAMRLAGAVAAIGGGFTIADALGAEVKTSGIAKAISLNSRKDGQVSISKEDVLGTAKGVAISHGMTTEDALGGIDAFLAKTGDAKTAKAVLNDLGDLATATGADFKELSTMAGLAWNSMSDKDKATRGTEGLMKMMRTAVAQGREGAMDIREFAAYGTRIFNSAAQFKGGVMENSEFIGGLAQVAMERGTATDSAEATESVKSLGLDVMTHQKALLGAGINGTVDKYGNLNNAQTVTEKLLLGTHGNVGELQKVGIERRSIKALEGDAMIFRKVFEEQTKAGKSQVQAETAGIEAVRAAHKKYMGIVYDAGDVQKESSERMQEVDKRLAAAMERLKISVGEELLPELIKLIPLIEKSIPAIAGLLANFVQLAAWVAENPIKAALIGVGAIVAKALIAEIVSAGISAAMTSLVSSIGVASVGLAALPALAVAAFAAAGIAMKIAADKQQEEDRRIAGDPGRTEAARENDTIDTLEKRKARLEGQGEGEKTAPSVFRTNRGISDDPNAAPITDVTSEGSAEWKKTVADLKAAKAARAKKIEEARKRLTVVEGSEEVRPGEESRYVGIDEREKLRLEQYLKEQATADQNAESAEKNVQAAKLNSEAATKALEAARTKPPPTPTPKTDGTL